MRNTTSIINDLIETLKDGQAGYRSAAEDVKSHDLKTLFNEYSLQRSKFAGELQALSHSLGEKEPETTGSAVGALHRAWIDLRSALSSEDEQAILAECERGEEAALAEYRKAVDHTDLPADVADTVRTQFVEVQAAHDHVRDLRESLSAK